MGFGGPGGQKYICSNCTCELGMNLAVGKDYRSMIFLREELTRRRVVTKDAEPSNATTQYHDLIRPLADSSGLCREDSRAASAHRQQGSRGVPSGLAPH